MDKTHIIDVDAMADHDKRLVPVVDLEKTQQDEEIILVGEKRKNADRQNRRNKRRKIELADESSMDPLHLFEQKEREFQRIRRNFPTTDPLSFLPFEIIEQICRNLNLRDYLYLLCINKAWNACRDVLPWKYLSAKMFDVTLMNKLKGMWYERLKFKLALEKNWRNNIKERVNTGKFYRLIYGVKLEKVFEAQFKQKRGPVAPLAYFAPTHVFQTDDNNILGVYQSDREWNRTMSRDISRWFLEKSEKLPDQISLEDVFNKRVKVLQVQEEDLVGRSFDLEADCIVQFLTGTSSFLIDRITTSQKITETEPTLAHLSFFHINGDFILYITPANQLMILNWKTNDVSSLEMLSVSESRVALALPKRFFNNCEYTIFADSERVILINLNEATVVRSYVSPTRFKPCFLQLWPGDKSKFFCVGSIMHIWSVYESRILDSILVHPIHPLSNNEAFPHKVKFHDNKVFLQYQTVTHILSKTMNGSYELLNSFKEGCFDFDECHLFDTEPFLHTSLIISDFSPKTLPANEQNNNTNQSNAARSADVQMFEVID